MDLNFLGGLAAAGNSFMREKTRVEDAELARANAAEERLYQQEQRSLKRGQDQRVLDEQGRADALRDANAAVPTETVKTLTQPNAPLVDDDGGPSAAALPAAVKQPVAKDAYLRQLAENHRKQGDIGKYLELTGQADKIGAARSAQKVVQLEASSAGMTTMQLAEAAREIFDDDHMPHKIGSITANDEGVVVEIRGENGGPGLKQSFASPAAILDGLRAMYSPEIQAQVSKARREALLKLAEPYTLNNGAKRFVGTQEVANNGAPKGYEDVLMPNGETVRRKILGKTEDPNKLINDAFEAVATKGNTKLEPSQYARGNRIAQQLVAENPGKVPVAMAVEVALSVALNPELAVPSIDKDTGRILTVYRHPEKGPFVIERSPPPDATPEMMKKAVAIMLKEQDPKVRAEMQSAAFEPGGSDRLLEAVFAEYDAKTAEQIKANPSQAKEIQQRADVMKQSSRVNLERKLKTIKDFGPQPKAPGSVAGFFSDETRIPATPENIKMLSRIGSTGRGLSAAKRLKPKTPAQPSLADQIPR